MVKTFSHANTYVHTMGYVHQMWADFFYVDGDFWENNIPIISATLSVQATRGGFLGQTFLSVSMVTYSGGAVGRPTVFNLFWNTGEEGIHYADYDFASNFYGIGLSPMRVASMPIMLPFEDIIYTALYILEVTY